MSIDILAASERPPQEPDFVWPGLMAGTVGALIAPGGTGKSFWALEAAMAVAGGEQADLLCLGPQHTGRVVYIAAEDPEEVYAQRIYDVTRYLSREAIHAVAERLYVEPIMGEELDVMRDQHRRRLVEYCTDTRLIVLDTLSCIHRLDENSNRDMAVLIAAMKNISVRTGAAVVFVHHVNKGSIFHGVSDQQQAARGASALIDNIRWCGYLAPMTRAEAETMTDSPLGVPIGDERRRLYVRYGVAKQNYGEIPPDRWYVRGRGGVLLPTVLRVIENRPDKTPRANSNGYQYA